MLERKTSEFLSEEALTKSLESARSWCKNSLCKHVRGVVHNYNYGIFRFIVDNGQIPDMCLDSEKKGLIRVSQRKLDFLRQREAIYGEITGAVVDLESIFIHEIAEFIVDADISVYSQNCVPFATFPHDIACKVENANRKERGLKPWPHS